VNARTTTRHRAWLIDLAIVVALALGWVAMIAAVTGGHQMVLFDTFRDMAWAENIRAGRIWTDPSLADQPYWYAPGSPLLMGAVAAATGRSASVAYSSSIFWYNVLIPLFVYLLARVVWDRATALVAVPAVLLGSYWWFTHAPAPIPGIQTIALCLLGFLCWHQCVSATRWGGGSAGAGVVLAGAAWQHPLCALILAGAIALHVALDAFVVGGRLRLLPRMAVVAVIAGAGAVPLIVHMLRLGVAGSPLLRFYASELVEPEFYAHAHTPLIVPAALVGVWFVARWQPQALWLVAWLLVGVLGQIAGYLGSWPHWPLPYVLPHEFQWHGQLALGLLAAVGIVGLARAWAPPARRRVAVPLCAILLLVVTVGPALRDLPRVGKDLLDLEPSLVRTQPLRTWIEQQTTLDDVFICDPDTAYRVVCGLTGRKCVATSAGHTNPAVDARRRLADVETLLRTDEPAAFAQLAGQYGAGYLLFAPTDMTEARQLRQRYADWGCLRPAFVPEDNPATVYRIVADEGGQQP
jgi:hypothetical protein